jgi:hypothetical protein
MTYTHIKFDLHFDSDTTSYYSLLEKVKNELKKAYFDCNTDDEVCSDSDSDNISGDDKDEDEDENKDDEEYEEVELISDK